MDPGDDDRPSGGKRDPTGRQRARLFNRRADADQFLTSEHSKLTGAHLDPVLGRITLSRFPDEHYRATMIGLESISRVRDESYLRTHILPSFGDRPLAGIGYTDCQAWINELSTRRAPATVVNAAQIMGKVMKTAVRARRIAHNPMAEVSLPTITEQEDIYLTPAQVELLATRWRRWGPATALVWLGWYGGPRIGELLALRWSAIDVLRRKLTISRKVIEVRGEGIVEGPRRPRPAAGR